MDLAFWAGRDQQVAPRTLGLSDPFYLECLAVGITPGPRTIAAADGTSGPILHFAKLNGVQPAYQFPREFGAIFKTAQSAGVLKGQPAVKWFEPNGALADLVLQEIKDVGHLEIYLYALCWIVMGECPVAFGAGRDQFFNPELL